MSGFYSRDEGKEQEVKRIEWVDVLKCMGIFTIYFWHLGEGTGYSYSFILRYHVPLFFFLSGCVESLQKESSIPAYVKKKAKSILVPFFLFSFLSMVLVVCFEGFEKPMIRMMLKQIFFGGRRNQIFAYSLWFLTCLFVTGILFRFIRMFKNRWLIFFAGAVLYVMVSRFLPYKPNMTPLLPYNVDCALYYMVYYCTGYCIFPKLQEFLQKEGKARDTILAAAGVAAGIYAAFLYFGHDLLSWILKVPVVRIFQPYAVAMILVLLNAEIAFFLRNCKIMQEIGKESLYLCGNEFIIKTLGAVAMSFFPIGIRLQETAAGALYVVALLLFSHFVLVPAEQKIMGKINL